MPALAVTSTKLPGTSSLAKGEAASGAACAKANNEPSSAIVNANPSRSNAAIYLLPIRSVPVCVRTREKPQQVPRSHAAKSNGRTAPPFVIPTEAKRSGGICSAPLGPPEFFAKPPYQRELSIPTTNADHTKSVNPQTSRSESDTVSNPYSRSATTPRG